MEARSAPEQARNWGIVSLITSCICIGLGVLIVIPILIIFVIMGVIVGEFQQTIFSVTSYTYIVKFVIYRLVYFYARLFLNFQFFAVVSWLRAGFSVNILATTHNFYHFDGAIIFRALIYWAHRAVVPAIAWHLVMFACTFDMCIKLGYYLTCLDLKSP